MSVAYAALYWFVIVTTLMSGALGFLLKLPNFYFPDVYLITGPSGALAAGTGSTPFEVLATYTFGILYVAPLVGMTYAFLEGTAAAKRAACLMPFGYHVASVWGVLVVFPNALNPAVATLASAAGMHAFYAFLLAALVVFATDTNKMKSS